MIHLDSPGTDEVARLRAELRETLQLLAAAVVQAGGELWIGTAALKALASDAVLSRRDDPQGVIVLRVRA